MFEHYAERRPKLHAELKLVRAQDDNYTRSPFVWLCSGWKVQKIAQKLVNRTRLQLRYEDLVHRLEQRLTVVLEVLGKPTCQEPIDSARSAPQSRSIRQINPHPPVTQALAGRLPQELGYEYQPTT